jgi:uncharacterized protein DUF6941
MLPMDAVLFLAADYANHEVSGKLNVLGVFSRILVNEFPATHRRLYLVIRVASRLGEFDTKHDFKVAFVDTDGLEIGAQEGELQISKPESGKQGEADLIIEVGNLRLPKPGNYEFQLIINRKVKAVIPLEVLLSNSTHEK